MSKILQKISSFFDIESRMKIKEYEYLSDAIDLVDLEYRQRNIQNNRAPFQR
jgi:hypothetical protein